MPEDTFERLDQTMDAALKVMQRDRKSKNKDPDVGPWAEENITFVTEVMSKIYERIELDPSTSGTVDQTQWEDLNAKRDKLIRQFEKGPEKKPKPKATRKSTLPPETQSPAHDFEPELSSRSYTTVRRTSSHHISFLELFGGAIMPKLGSSPGSSKSKSKSKPESKSSKAIKTSQYWTRREKPSEKSASGGNP